MDNIADEAVVATNDDAAICKYQAVQKGYYNDPYIDKLLSSRAKTTMTRKPPEINRGYFARSITIAYLVEQFLEHHADGQVISLGAGYDTLYWRLKSNQLLTNRNKYIEIDMAPVALHKIMAIKRHKELSSPITNIKLKGEGLHSDDYHFITFDLRQVDKTPLHRVLIDECQLDPAKPTICLAECVLVYMPIQDSYSLIKWLSESFKNLSVINYEQCNMADKFGEIMLANMTARNCDLMGVEACKSLDHEMDRFKTSGLIHTMGWTMAEILHERLYCEIVEKATKIEFLDENELLDQLLQHYCIVVGSHNSIDWIPEDSYWKPKTTAI